MHLTVVTQALEKRYLISYYQFFHCHIRGQSYKKAVNALDGYAVYLILSYLIGAMILTVWHTVKPLIYGTPNPKNLSVSHLILQLSLLNLLKQGVKLWRCSWSTENRLSTILSDQQFYCLLKYALYTLHRKISATCATSVWRDDIKKRCLSMFPKKKCYMKFYL